MQLADDFSEALEAEPHVVMVLDPQLRIGFINRAWQSHAERDQAPASCAAPSYLGVPYLGFVKGELRSRLAKGFELLAQAKGGFGSVWFHSECNTPQVCRRLTTRLSALWDEQLTGYVVHNTIRVVGSMRERYDFLELALDDWRDAQGLITQCSCCRRVRHPVTAAWAVSVELIENSRPGVSHGLCELCLDTYYGEVAITPTPPAGEGPIEYRELL